ncbi:MAG: hypothetical protein N5P05_003909 [Chroococcopsis gigantea SAG 12.99]|jgi:predicted enzyme related to lactoylglutathione lyase|nr:VOC family protein [Chlorogloea purpurea SAG 13.99]MDV3002303.1 hypothetical protein [Chroococcopsis gigantea SAG 12.99]
MNYQEVFITIGTTDFEAVVLFYREVFSVSADVYQGGAYAQFNLMGLKLAIFYPKESHQSQFANSGGSGVSFCVEVENLEETIAHLARLGYPPTSEITRASHGLEIYAYDPAGNRLIFHQSTLNTKPFK